MTCFPDELTGPSCTGRPGPSRRCRRADRSGRRRCPGSRRRGGPGHLTGTACDCPCTGASFGAAFSRFFRKYAVFSGRASRSECWYAALALVVLNLIPLEIYLAGGLLLVLLFLVVLVPSIAVAVRRLHDANLSGRLYLLTVIPSVGPIIPLVLVLLPLKTEGSRFDRV